MVAPEEGLYKQKRGASFKTRRQRGADHQEEEDGRLQAEVDPLADVASMRTVELVGGVGMEEGEDGEEEKIEEKEGDRDGAPVTADLGV